MPGAGSVPSHSAAPVVKSSEAVGAVPGAHSAGLILRPGARGSDPVAPRPAARGFCGDVAAILAVGALVPALVARVAVGAAAGAAADLPFVLIKSTPRVR